LSTREQLSKTLKQTEERQQNHLESEFGAESPEIENQEKNQSKQTVQQTNSGEIPDFLQAV
jgi:hypothetical protein